MRIRAGVSGEALGGGSLLGLVPADDDDPGRAGGRKGEGDAVADAPAAAGDEHGPAGLREGGAGGRDGRVGGPVCPVGDGDDLVGDLGVLGRGDCHFDWYGRLNDVFRLTWGFFFLTEESACLLLLLLGSEL